MKRRDLIGKIEEQGGVFVRQGGNTIGIRIPEREFFSQFRDTQRSTKIRRSSQAGEPITAGCIAHEKVPALTRL